MQGRSMFPIRAEANDKKKSPLTKQHLDAKLKGASGSPSSGIIPRCYNCLCVFSLNDLVLLFVLYFCLMFILMAGMIDYDQPMATQRLGQNKPICRVFPAQSHLHQKG